MAGGIEYGFMSFTTAPHVRAFLRDDVRLEAHRQGARDGGGRAPAQGGRGSRAPAQGGRGSRAPAQGAAEEETARKRREVEEAERKHRETEEAERKRREAEGADHERNREDVETSTSTWTSSTTTTTAPHDEPSSETMRGAEVPQRGHHQVTMAKATLRSFSPSHRLRRGLKYMKLLFLLFHLIIVRHFYNIPWIPLLGKSAKADINV